MSQNKISRRDALKILGAAIGGAALSTIPAKWSKPALAASELPEHARQSEVLDPTPLSCRPSVTATAAGMNISTAVVLSNGNGVPVGTTVSYLLTINSALGTISGSKGPFSGTFIEDATGLNNVYFPTQAANITGFVAGDTVAITLTALGSSCTYTITVI